MSVFSVSLIFEIIHRPARCSLSSKIISICWRSFAKYTDIYVYMTVISVAGKNYTGVILSMFSLQKWNLYWSWVYFVNMFNLHTAKTKNWRENFVSKKFLIFEPKWYQSVEISLWRRVAVSLKTQKSCRCCPSR